MTLSLSLFVMTLNSFVMTLSVNGLLSFFDFQRLPSRHYLGLSLWFVVAILRLKLVVSYLWPHVPFRDASPSPHTLYLSMEQP